MYEICVYYNKRTEKIISFLPNDLDDFTKSKIIQVWNNPIMKKILKNLSLHESLNLSELKKLTKHSISTISEAINKLNSLGIVEVKMTYKEKKQKIVKSKVLFVTENPKLKKIFVTLLNQGIWIDKEKSKKIIEFLENHPDKMYTAEEISARTRIPVDEVKALLNNWDSQITRAISDFMREPPFEKITMYRAKKKKKN